ncbi:VTT domain-containing protein [Methylococcus sp. Mc7]|uniref:VTT domain-containing protein n=1 Tax=Methylococcus sp. Mc7 TaxID=2860258 RepID=UPI001C5309B1|nr:VTT domain-containing protein [Methylococcus sp. Mc7]QXP85300.1 VTT domain-containing protein [Methylococcus sp. Mc7]
MSLEAVHLWVGQHPHLAGLAVFAIVLAESLAVVGLLLPGTVLIFTFGTLVGGGSMDFVSTYAWALSGALLGDGISFWLGRSHRQRIRTTWPFSRFPAVLERGIGFFRRYGGHSVLFGRFFGAVRGIVPLVAGMAGMPSGRFVGYSAVAAALWVPVFLAPGILFGASLELASGTTARLVGLGLGLIALLWLAVWLTARVYAFLQPRARDLILLMFRFAGEHRLFGRITLPLLDSERRDYGGLALVGGLILAAVFAVGRLFAVPPLPVSFAAWRTPEADYGFTVLESLGSRDALLIEFGVLALWLSSHRSFVALAHWLIAAIFALSMGWMGDHAFAAPPFDTHVLRGCVASGFVAVLVAPAFRKIGGRVVYAVAAALVVALGFARIYLDRSEIPAVLFALAVGLAWLIPLGIACRRHCEAKAASLGAASLVTACLTLVLAAEAVRHGPAEFVHDPLVRRMTTAEWLADGWKRLPAYRLQPLGRPHQPLPLQWATTLDAARENLEKLGWRMAVPLSWMSALQWFNPRAKPEEWPVLARFNEDSEDALRMLHPENDGRWAVLRLWPSRYVLAESGVPLWVGRIDLLEAANRFGFLGYFREARASDRIDAAALLAPERVRGLVATPVVRDAGYGAVLIRER